MADGLHLNRTPWHLTPMTDEARKRPAHYNDPEEWDVHAQLAHRMELAANVIFPSMCANNMDAYNINEELRHYAASSPSKDRK